MGSKYDLSIIIPARNEEFLSLTVEDIIKNKRGKTEILIGLDGQWASPSVKQHKDVTVFYSPVSIGQRAMMNQLARLSQAKYIMKVDAHCSFDMGFDIKMMARMSDDLTMVPIMKNLHVFDWVCKECGDRRYQGTTPTECNNRSCTSTSFVKDIVWKAKESPNSVSYRFDKTLHFQYWKELIKRDTYKKQLKETGLTETMSLQGSCFLLTRDKYWELGVADEKHGSWGQQGVEVACKTWLSGGRVVVNHDTWYAHLFRTQGGDFGFPYPNPGITKARQYSRELWINNSWAGATRPFSWLLEHFAPVPDWDSLVGGVIYYTDNKLDASIMTKCQEQLKQAIGDKRLVSISLEPISFGDNIHMPLERGYVTMAKQILAGLKELDTDYVFFCEHDVLYHPSHFDFVPPKDDVYYYNTNVWRVRYSDGLGVKVDDCRQLSGLCANRELLIKHYEKRVSLLEKREKEEDFNRYIRKMGFEPGTHGRAERVDDYKSEVWNSRYPNLDIRHDGTLTPSRWSKDEFRNEKYTVGWTQSTKVEGWGELKKAIC